MTNLPLEASRITEWLELDLSQLKGKRVLDLGAGNCYLGRLLEHAKVSIISLDVQYDRIAPFCGLKNRLNAHAKHMPIRSESIDLVISVGAPPCVNNVEASALQIMEEICRVLKPNGKALLTANTGLGFLYEQAILEGESSRQAQLRRIHRSTAYLQAHNYPVILHSPYVDRHYWSMSKPQQQPL